MRPPCRPRRAFSLTELVVASVIASILAGAATVGIRRLVDGRDRSKARQAAVASVNAVAQSIARDMANVARDTDLLSTIVRLDDTTGAAADAQADELLLFCRSDRPARPLTLDDDPEYRESGLFEVQYRLKPDEELAGILWRRADPVIDGNHEGGGVAVPLATRLLSLDFEAFDGEEWQTQWDSDMDGLPHALRVTCQSVMPENGGRVFARATVALDRIPPPFDPSVDETYDPASDIENLDFGLPTPGEEEGGGIDFGGGGIDFGGGGFDLGGGGEDRGGDGEGRDGP